MSIQKHSTVVGVFPDQEAARPAVNELREAGFREDQIGVVGRRTDASVTGETATGAAGETKWEEGAAAGAAGAAAGAGVGALWALGITAGVLPVVGPVIAGGLMASVLASAAGGAAVAGIVGALVGLGVPEEHARCYEAEVHAGRTLVTVQAPGRYEEVEEIFRRRGATGVNDTHPAAGTARS
jgi:hypothetical protein